MYYICTLTTGKILDFGKRCKKIKWDNDVFKAESENGTCIGIVPTINVESFLLIEGEEHGE